MRSSDEVRAGGSRPDPAPRPAPRWLGRALLASVVVNLVLAGLLVGSAMRAEPGERERRPSFAERIAAELPEARRAEVLRLLDEPEEAWPERRARLVEATDRAAEALAAEPFDRTAFEAAMRARMEVFAGRFEARIDRFGALTERLTVEERARLAEAMRARMASRIARIEARRGSD